MDQGFFEYLAMSPRGRSDYLNFIIELADIAINNVGKCGISEETVAKARICRADALRQLEHMTKEQESSVRDVRRRYGREK
jgi:hypothetical protein